MNNASYISLTEAATEEHGPICISKTDCQFNQLSLPAKIGGIVAFAIVSVIMLAALISIVMTVLGAPNNKPD